MRAIALGDVHLADKPPSTRTEDYAERMLNKLEFAVETAIQEKVEVLAIAGDLFHIKTPGRTSHWLVVQTLRILQDAQRAGVEVLAVPGNHDLRNDRLESIPGQPLGVLERAGIKLLMGRHERLPIVGIPWLADWRDLPKWFLKVGKLHDTDLVVTHAPIMPPGVTAPYDYIDATQWGDLQHRGKVFYGHIHDLHGAYHAGGDGVAFCNNGALSRGSIHESDLVREPSITLVDTEEFHDADKAFKRIIVPHGTPDEVYTTTTKKAARKQVSAEEFLVAITAQEMTALTPEAVAAHVRSLGLEGETENLIMELLEDASR